MVSHLIRPQSVRVQIYGNNPKAGVLIVIERADDPAQTRTFDIPMTRRELQQLRDAILSRANERITSRIAGSSHPSGHCPLHATQEHSAMAKYTFKQFQAEYPNDAACLAKLMEINFGGTEITCPGCGVERAKFHPMTKRRAFACQECGHHIYPAAGTIFHKSRTNLTKWFFAMYLMTSTRHGVAAKEIERQLGVTYKCAWRMCHELRKLMAAADHDFGGGPGLKGHVEIDETLVGGRRKANEPENKTIVMGLLQRDGKIVAAPIPDVTMTRSKASSMRTSPKAARSAQMNIAPTAGYITPTITAQSITQPRNTCATIIM